MNVLYQVKFMIEKCKSCNKVGFFPEITLLIEIFQNLPCKFQI